MSELTLHVDGMGCRECVRDVTARLRDVAGVQTVAADHRRSVIRLGGSMSLHDVLAALEKTPYRIDRIDADSDETGSGQQSS